MSYIFFFIILFWFFFCELDLKLSLPLFLSWFRKLCELGCFCGDYGLNKLSLDLFLLFFFLLSFFFRNHTYIQGRSFCVHGRSHCYPSKFTIKKIKHFVNPLFISKAINKITYFEFCDLPLQLHTNQEGHM